MASWGQEEHGEEEEPLENDRAPSEHYNTDGGRGRSSPRGRQTKRYATPNQCSRHEFQPKDGEVNKQMPTVEHKEHPGRPDQSRQGQAAFPVDTHFPPSNTYILIAGVHLVTPGGETSGSEHDEGGDTFHVCRVGHQNLTWGDYIIEIVSWRAAIWTADSGRAENRKHANLATSTRKLLGEIHDLVIVFGDDGGVLGPCPAQYSRARVNRDSLGLLIDIHPDDLEVKDVEELDSHYLMENRLLLQAACMQMLSSKGRAQRRGLHPGKSTRMIQFEIFDPSTASLSPARRLTD
ncbi:hypothetical protein CONLIGDRAFT_685952 [Coniochaeta ligniaria NRRL 30616]|uniref:Uncharacterized protein n=1 Tax=Coniochaeta ligniaria NRRL 30616 TaxID=1408157 RepID=A0A1J7ITA8_9PEZI|nr:hypothetical protein CONLIGDRAFT_685952 [Coniochaeta ligniaria NRRL 30616]